MGYRGRGVGGLEICVTRNGSGFELVNRFGVTPSGGFSV